MGGCERSCAVKGDPNVLIGGTFELTDQTGNRVSESAFRGKYMLVYFGYTFCPDVCPVDLQRISAALDLVGETSAIQPVFVTIDPARDTVQAMATYTQHFHPALMGLTGTEEEIATATSAYRIFFAKAPNAEDPDAYLMNHSSYIYLMDCDGNYIRHFSSDSTPEEIAAALKAVI